MTKLKDYDANMENRVPKPKPPLPSGIACTEKKCKGEMMIIVPEQNHPELPHPDEKLPPLKRAVCSKCGWRGWV